MDTILIAATGVSLVLAAAMGALLARMIRDERRRSDARVQLLEQLAGRTSALRYTELDEPFPAAQDFRLRAERSGGPAGAWGEAVTPASVPVQRTDLFHDEPTPSPWPRRFAVIGSLAAAFALAIFTWSQMRATPSEPAATAATSAPAPLELLSLRHAREGNTLTVTGLVQNPTGAPALSNVQATVFVFGPGGTFITSARAPLDFTSLTPGDESPFVVKVPVSGAVSRYRVGFRGPDDRVVGHVDRRTDQVGRNF